MVEWKAAENSGRCLYIQRSRRGQRFRSSSQSGGLPRAAQQQRFSATSHSGEWNSLPHRQAPLLTRPIFHKLNETIRGHVQLPLKTGKHSSMIGRPGFLKQRVRAARAALEDYEEPLALRLREQILRATHASAAGCEVIGYNGRYIDRDFEFASNRTRQSGTNLPPSWRGHAAANLRA
jgi:hypothetical protein